jgi:hypothetical protein
MLQFITGIAPYLRNRSLDAALDDDDMAIRVLNNNIDSNGTGQTPVLCAYSLASMLANLIQDGTSKSPHDIDFRFSSKRGYFCAKFVLSVTSHLVRMSHIG